MSFNLLSRFIWWLKKIFRISLGTIKEEQRGVLWEEKKSPYHKEEASETKPTEEKMLQIPPEKKTEAVPISEEATPSNLLSDKEPVEIKPSEEKASEVPREQEISPELSPKEPKEKILTSESVVVDKTKIGKPYIKKLPTEEREKNINKLSEEEKEAPISKSKTHIDLGEIEKRKKSRGIKQARPPPEGGVKKRDKAEEKKETFMRVGAPYIELDLDETKVFFIIPKQQFETNAVSNIPQALHYKLEINGNEQTISVRVSNNGQSIATVEEKRIELKQLLNKFKITYPDELQGRVYSYQHQCEILYAFIAIGNNRGRMYYLSDKDGNMNPLPKKSVWILLEEGFEVPDVDIIEERWIWEKYRPLLINLKNKDELVIKNRQTKEEKKIPCEPSFSLECEALIEDDFKDQMPLFVGNSIKIEAPTVNQSGWAIWVQNKQAGYKVITKNWTGNEPLELRLPDNLPCECGEFQVDICEQEDSIPIETLFFRYIPCLQLKFPRDLIVPDPNKGHKVETVEILFEKDFQDWELKYEETVVHENIGNGFQIKLPPQQDVIRFSLMKKGKPETETRVKITIPRLKWRTSKSETWSDRPIQIKRNELISGDNFYLVVCTNDFSKRYEFLGILETAGQKMQEAKFHRNGMVYNLLLNQFFDTIKKTKAALSFVLILNSLKIELLNISCLLKCKLCNSRVEGKEDIEFHTLKHLPDLIKPDLQKIYKCYNCNFYVENGDPLINPTTAMSEHFQKNCPKARNGSRCFEFIEVPVTKCTLCEFIFKHQDEKVQLKHLLEEHQYELYCCDE